MATTLSRFPSLAMDTNRIIENINSTVVSRNHAATPIWPEEQVSLEPSNLCQTCQCIFDIEYSTQPWDSAFISGRNPGEILHHSLDDLAARAVRGCHLCLTVYLNLDPEALKNFRRKLFTAHGKDVPFDGSVNLSLGFASISPIARDQARLNFRFIQNPSLSEDLASVRTGDGSGKAAEALGLGFLPGLEGLNDSRTTLASGGSGGSGTPQKSEGDLGVELILMNPRYAVEPGVRTINAKSTSTASAESLEIAKQWIKECSFNHMKCSVNEGSGRIWKPTHLLDVTVRGLRGVPGVKLVDGMFVDPMAEYVTLSHCWGPPRASTPGGADTKRIRLHKGTLSALRQGVAGSSLPRTFAEAAIAAEKLGYRYLWIDALCIMHDNEKLVLQEIANMHKIYSEASLNIAATGSREDSQGLFYGRNVAALQPAVVEVGDGFGIDGGVYKVLRSTIWEDLVDKSPLCRRAWVFQERCLSKRTLHFTRNELLWECQQTCCSEVFPKGLPVTMGSMAARERKTNGEKPTTEAFNKRTHHQKTGNWHQLVAMYSLGKLTYTSDKLLGISGLARNYATRNRLQESDYLVGIWKSQLPHALLWRADQGKRPGKYRAPSWTWASIDGAITYPEPSQASRQACLEVIDVKLQHSADVMGQCESGHIKVRGFMGKGTLKRTQDYWGKSSCTIYCSKATVNFQSAWFDDRLLKLSDDGVMTEILEVYLLPVIDVMDRVEGLILSATMKKGDFKRIGTFEISMKDQENWDRFRSVMKGDPEMSNYEERLDHTNGYWFASDYTYTINLL